MAPPPKAGNEHFIVLLNKVEAAIPRHKGCDLLSILDQLDSDALSNSRVGLLGLHSTGGGRRKGGEGGEEVVEHIGCSEYHALTNAQHSSGSSKSSQSLKTERSV